jgi:hypothetical protein
MKAVFLLACVFCCLGWECDALVFGDMGAREVKGELKCEVRLATNNVPIGSRIPIFLTVTNIGSLEAELPSPAAPESVMRVRIFLLSAQTTGAVQRLWVPNGVLETDPTPEQQRVVKEVRAEDWHKYFSQAPRWISIPPHGKKEFQILVEMSPKTYDGSDYGADVAPPPATYGLQCEINYDPTGIGSATFIETNGLVSAEDIARAKASGIFLLDTHRLWTGTLDSDIVPITLTGGR